MIDSVDVILLCGGKGTRLHSVTKDRVPKSLYKLNNTELIKLTTDNLDFSYTHRLIFAVNHQADAVQTWVKAQNFPCDTHFSTQEKSGILGAVRSALDYVKTENFVVCNTDEMRSGMSMKRLLQNHTSNQNTRATMLTTVSDHLHLHRVVVTNDRGQILRTELKNTDYKNCENTENQINVGFIVFNKKAAEFFDRSRGDDWSSLIDPLIEKGLMIAVVNTSLQYFNIGTSEELDQARNFLRMRAKKAR